MISSYYVDDVNICFYMLFMLVSFFFFKQKTAYEMRISDWSSDVCSSDLAAADAFIAGAAKPKVEPIATEADEAGQGAEPRKSPVMLRFDRALLAKVDAAAKRRGISRSAWIQFTVSRALDAGEG